MRNSVLCKWLIPLSVIVVSCVQEPETEKFWERDLVISASQESAGTEDPGTRTVLVDELNVYWTASDKLLVFRDYINSLLFCLGPVHQGAVSL